MKAVFGKHCGRVSEVLALGTDRESNHQGTLFATGGQDGQLALWDPRRSAGSANSKGGHSLGAAILSTIPHKRHGLPGHSSAITALAELPRISAGSAPMPCLVSGGGNGSLFLLEPRRNMEPVLELLGQNQDDTASAPIASLCIRSRGRANALIFTGRADGCILAHDPYRGENAVYAFMTTPGSAMQLAATDSSLVSSGTDGFARIFRLSR